MILTLFLTHWTSFSNAQTLGDNIIEVFWDKDTIETFDYTIEVISNNDTIRQLTFFDENIVKLGVHIARQQTTLFRKPRRLGNQFLGFGYRLLEKTKMAQQWYTLFRYSIDRCRL